MATPVRRNSDAALKRRLVLLLVSATVALGVGVGGLIIHVPGKGEPFAPLLVLLLLALLGLCLLAAALLLAIGATMRRCLVARRWRRRRVVNAAP